MNDKDILEKLEQIAYAVLFFFATVWYWVTFAVPAMAGR